MKKDDGKEKKIAEEGENKDDEKKNKPEILKKKTAFIDFFILLHEL